MEVDAVQANNLVNHFDEQADSPDDFGDPSILPRVGKQYQVEIPENPHVVERTAFTFQDHQVGLLIPIMWIKDEVENNKHDPLKHACKSIGVTNESEFSKLECIKETQNSLDNDKLNPEPEAIDNTLVNGTKLVQSGKSNVQQETKIEMHEKDRGKGYCLVPGSASDPWNEIEKASFTLGLYIFGKNHNRVKRFIGNKTMGDILSFYYGKFYKSDAYQRWCRCRKMRSRKCIYGQKIFTGPRQQELLSRLLANKSEECHSKLLEVSKTFVEGKMDLKDYVLTLKASVGLNALVEAVGIGKGKEDLTGFTADSMKSTQARPVRPEIPVGKDYSRLTHAEIISFLTGNFRLSKTRSSDLFWEAVWPRLLARGWHSEQLGSDKDAAASKHPLLFFVPGVIKFSRKLVRGNQYFDSISDILGKVASDPKLIELETVADDCTSKEGNGLTKETNLDHKNCPDQQRHCYLKPRTSICSTDVKMFTVVDTSLGSEKVKELRSLPDGVVKASTLEYDSDDEDTSEQQINESDFVDNVCFDKEKTDSTNASKFINGKGVSSDMNGIENNHSKEILPTISTGSTNPSAASSKDQKTDSLSNTQIRDAMKSQSIQRVEPDSTNVVVPVPKRPRRLKTCSRAERNLNNASIFMVPGGKQEAASFSPDNSKPIENVAANISVTPGAKQEKASNCPLNSKFSENVLSQEIPAEEKNLLAGLLPQENMTLADPLSIPSTNISREAVPATSFSGTKDQSEKPHPRTIIIDLNLPVSPEVDADEPFVAESQRQQNNTGKESDDPSVETISKPVDHSEHQPDMNTRRKSTRTMQPTIRVLEALASGCLDTKEKRKRRDYLQDNLLSTTSRRTRPKVAGETSNNGVADFQNEERANVAGNGSGNDNSNSNVICTGFKSREG